MCGPPASQVVNMFGTTETQRSVGYYEVPRDAAQLAKLKEIIPCGRGMHMGRQMTAGLRPRWVGRAHLWVMQWI